MTIEIEELPKEVLAVLGKRDADFLEKFVGKVLKLSSEHWAKLTTEAYEKAGPGGSPEYNHAFDQWHRLRLNQVHLDDEARYANDRREEMPWEPTADTTTSTEPTSSEG